MQKRGTRQEAKGALSPSWFCGLAGEERGRGISSLKGRMCILNLQKNPIPCHNVSLRSFVRWNLRKASCQRRREGKRTHKKNFVFVARGGFGFWPCSNRVVLLVSPVEVEFGTRIVAWKIARCRGCEDELNRGRVVVGECLVGVGLSLESWKSIESSCIPGISSIARETEI